MIYFVVLILTATLIEAVSITQCTCYKFYDETSCVDNLSCYWDSTLKSCYPQNDPCTFYTLQSHCDFVDGCAWNNNGTCSAFTQCSDYTITNSTNADQCFSKNSTCLPDQPNTDGSVTCKKGEFQCSLVQDQLICPYLYQSDGQWCISIDQKCVAQNVTKCTTITSADPCVLFFCDWQPNSSTCLAPSCSGRTTEDRCTIQRKDILGEGSWCSWCNGQCIAVADTKTSGVCYYFGNGLYQLQLEYNYINSTCPEAETYTSILAIGLLIISLY